MAIWNNRYGEDPLSSQQRPRRSYPTMEGNSGLIIEDASTEFAGAIVGFEKSDSGLLVRLEDRHGTIRVFPCRPGALLYEGTPITLLRPSISRNANQLASREVSTRLTHSGARKAPVPLRARTARASRIWVEGAHDAIIVQQVWGEDLAELGIVVEELKGLDNLHTYLRNSHPGPQRRIGVLADHLIEGTKEARIISGVGPHVMVTGHPFVDIWAAVKPSSVGIDHWPDIPKGEEWKTGICTRLGWGTPQEGWQHVRRAVTTYKDLDSTLIGAVERLIDFVMDGD